MVIALWVLLMAITGGGGATIFVYDDTNNTNHPAAPGPHTFAEIAAAFPADFANLGTNQRSYRALQTVQIGDGGVGSATTTLTDSDCTVIWDNTKTLAFRNSSTTSWFLNLGTKVGTGNTASGKAGVTLVFGAATTFRGNNAIYGCNLKSANGVITFLNAVGTTSDIQNTLIQSSVAGVAPILFQPTAGAILNAYNIDISHASTSQTLSSFLFSTAERITVCASAPSFFLTTAAVSLAVKDLKLIGSPTTSDIRWSAGGPSNWQIVKPQWSQAAPKFSAATANPSLSVATWEYWLWDVKVVDGAGVGISGVPVKLTDVTGEVQVDTTTGSDGQIVFGSGVTANAVKVMDHYVVAPTTYTQRHRSPFLVEINTGGSALVGYQSKRYNFYWPGYEAVTTNSGLFEDVADIVSLGEPSGGPTNWVELAL